MAMHAAACHGVDAVGITCRQSQLDHAQRAVKEAWLDNRVDIRLQDYREGRRRP